MSQESRAVLSGAIAGVVGGLAGSVVTLIAVEPAIGAAIAFENALAHATGEEHHGAEVISRGVQSSVGVFTSVGLFGAAMGIVIGVIAYALGRMIPELSPRLRAVTATALTFVSVFLVPFLVYPSNPPAVGSEATLTIRTATYYAFMGISAVAMMAAVVLTRALSHRIGWWNAAVAAAGAYLVVVITAAVVMPTRIELNGGINEVPEGFPASTLSDFRVGSLLVAAAMYAVILVLLPTIQARMARRTHTDHLERQPDHNPSLINS